MKTEYRKWISKRLINLRLLYKKTQEEIATGINIKRPAYASYEEGRAEPSLYVIEKICAFYNIDANTFLIGSPMKTSC